MNLEIMAVSARKWLDQRLDNCIDSANNDKSLSPDIQDQLVYLRCNEAWQLTEVTKKFRQQLQRSNYIHEEVERAIRFLETDIQHYATFLDVDTLFLQYFVSVYK